MRRVVALGRRDAGNEDGLVGLEVEVVDEDGREMGGAGARGVGGRWWSWRSGEVFVNGLVVEGRESNGRL